ncbi:MAG: OmpA family protein [Lentisphaeria bacterium]|nr:OmpA family protein [Lentisphaeria bacterium]
MEGGGIGEPGGGDVSGIGRQPGAYQQGAGVGVNDYDGFGTPIPGVQFQPLYFKFDQAIVDPDEAAKVDAVVKYLQGNPGTGVVIEGNCDTRGTNEYNRALGERRALAAQEMMVGAGIDASRIKTLSYGEEKVAVQGETEEAHAQNRRDEFVAVKLAK